MFYVKIEESNEQENVSDIKVSRLNERSGKSFNSEIPVPDTRFHPDGYRDTDSKINA